MLTPRMRSPNYPAIALPKALPLVGAAFREFRLAPMSRLELAGHCGFRGLSGASVKVSSALLKYGLILKTADGLRRVSELAARILEPRSPGDRAVAIREAALRPRIFAAMNVQCGGHDDPNTEQLREFLRDRDFIETAITDVIATFQETRRFVAQETQVNSESVEQGSRDSSGHRQTPAAETVVAPFTVRVGPHVIAGEFLLRDRATLDQLLAALRAVRALLPEAIENGQA